MMYPQSIQSPAMSIDIRLNMYRNPMDLSSLLNPYPTPPASDEDEEDEEETEDEDERDYDDDEMTHSLSYECRHGHSAPQPMEIDGEVRPHQPSSFNNDNRLPPIRLLTGSNFSVPIAYRPASPPHRSSESFLESHDRRRSSSYSNSSRRHHHHRGSEFRRRRLSPSQPRISPSPSLSSSFTTPDARCIIKDGKKKRKKSPTGPHNNRPYTQEQVQWIRYHKEDCGMMGQALYALWLIRFPNDLREEGQSFSSRTYRDNIIPVADDNGDLVFDKSGKPLLIKCGVRERNLPEHKDFPFKLVDKHPEWALYWDWVSPEHKEMAQKILDGDLDESQKRKEKSRRALRKWQAIQPARKGWYSTPAQHAEAMRKEHKLKAKTNGLAGTSSSFHSSISSQPNAAFPNHEDKRPIDWYMVDDGGMVMKQEQTELS